MPSSKQKDRFSSLRPYLSLLVAGCFLSQQTFAATQPTVMPTGGAYAAGSGSIKTSGNAVTINQSTLRGIIDWSTFSIGQGGTVTFNNGSGATLNRVNGAQMSSILGSLLSSGSVYLINPQGILIGPGAHVKTGGDFVASTLKIAPDIFLSGGALSFSGSSKAFVVNLGDVFSNNGSVFLIAHGVQNTGTIAAPNGTAGLGAGSEVLLKDSTADQRVFVKAAGGDVTNTGAISAAQVELKAKGGNVYALAGNSGTIAATGTATIDGRAWLISDGGKTQVTGTVSAQNANGRGGAIETSGHDLDISHATVKTGQAGNWLLDPIDLTIDSNAATTIENSLATTNVNVQTTATTASGPGQQNSSGNGDIIVASNIGWASNNSLTLSAYRNISFNNNVSISNTGAGNLMLRADNTSSGTGTVSFGSNANLNWSQSTGITSLLYNPADVDFRYDTPSDFSPYFLSNSSWVAPANRTVSTQMTAYMLVNNATDLSHLNNQLGGTFALGKTIDASSVSNFTEQAATSPGFTGTFDGFGNSITGLTMSRNAPALGLFGYVGQGGIIRNLVLTNLSLSQIIGTIGGEVGGLVGSNSGTLANITIGGTVKNYNGPYQTGGVVGVNSATGVLYNVQSSVAVDESSSAPGFLNDTIGGIAGDNEGLITNSTASGTITGSGISFVGGMAGVNNGTISNSSSSATVTDSDDTDVQAGGLIGSNTGTLTGVSASGNVSGTSVGIFYGGGLIGWSNSALSGLTATGNVSTTSTFAQVGGLVGHQESTIDSSTASGSVTSGSSAAIGGLVGKVSGNVTNSSASGAVTSGSGSLTGGLAGWATAAISGSNSSSAVTSQNAGSIGGLAGQVDGAVNNSFATGAVSASHSTMGGLVGAANSTIDNSHATGNVSGADAAAAGGLVGNVTGAVTTSYAQGSVIITGDGVAGGLAGITGDAVTNSYATGSVHVDDALATAVGGLIGTANGSNPISASHATGNVSTNNNGSSAYVGGLIGLNHSPVNTVYATGNVSGGINSDLGGLIGSNTAAVSASNATGTVTGGSGVDGGGLVGLSSPTGTVAGSNATGAVTVGNGSDAGGLVGHTVAAVSNSFANGPVAGGVNGDIGGLVGYTSSSISGSHATGNVSSAGASEGTQSTGGLVGLVDTNGSVSTSQASGNVTGTGSYGSYGGLIGNLTGTLTSDSNSTGNVTVANNQWAGGLVGQAATPLSGFTVVANVLGGNDTQLGGLVGHTASTVSNSTSSGFVTGGVDSTVGGVGGEVNGAITNVSSSATVAGGTGATVAGMAGFAYSTVTGSSASGAVTGGSNSLAGGLIGGSGGNVSGSSATGNVTGGFAAGGLIAATNGNVTVDSSTASGTVAAVLPPGATAGGIAGGLLGIASGSVTNSHATGAVSAGDGIQSCEGPCNIAGGLIGWMTTSNGRQTVSNSFATGNVLAGAGYEVGGLIGENHVPVTSSYATGNVQGGIFAAVGGLIGYTFSTVNQSHATGNVSVGAADEADPFSNAIAGGLIGGTANGINVTASYASGSVTGGDYSNIGGLIGVSGSSGQITTSYASGTVTGTSGVSAGGLVGFNNSSVTGSYATGNVTIGDSPGQGNPWGYAGGLLGNSAGGNVTGSYATGTVVSGAWAGAGGLAGAISGDISGSHATGNVTTGYGGETGGLTGENGGTISHSYATGSVTAGDDISAGGLSGNAYGNIDHSYATGNVTAGTSAAFNDGCNCSDIGGLVGYSNGTVSTSFATGQVSAQGVGLFVGGLVGYSDSGTEISQSYATGAVSASGQNSIAGGLAGLTLALVADSYATGSVSASGTGSIAGGLVGQLNVGTVDNPGAPAVSSSYSIGAVSGADTMGGLIGQNQGTANLTDAFWDTTTSAQTTSAGGTGLTTKQWLTLGPVATNDSNWDFTNTWVQGYPYPVLKAFPYVVGTVTPSGDRIYGAADPSISLTAAVDQNGNNALGSIQGTFAAVTPVINANVGVNNLGGSGQFVPGSQLTYIGSMNIDPATLTFTGLAANNKVYDGTTSATLSLGSLALSGVLEGDNVSINTSAVLASFLNKNVGTGKTVDVTGLTLSGSAAGNYIFAPELTTTANITPATLVETFTANNKVYDSTVAATVNPTPLSGVFGSDAVSLASATYNFSDKNVGTGKSVNGSNAVLSGADAANYVVDFVESGTANITPALITLAGTTSGVNKVYDGTTAATVTGASLNGVFSGDSVNLVQSATFSDKNAGTNKTVDYTNAIAGTDAGNYVFEAPPSGATTANITPATLIETFTANNKVYDRTTAATASLGTLSGVIGEDSVAVQGGTFNFSDKNAGSGKTVAGSAAVLSGTDAGNYVVDFVQNGTAAITPATLTESFTANNKVYDGTTTATVSSSSGLSGILPGDAVSLLSANYNFSDKNAASGKTVSASGIALTGADAGNYVLILSQDGTASITPAQLFYTAQPGTYRPFGANNPTIPGTITGLVGGDSLASVVSGNLVFSTLATSSSAVGSYAVTGSGLSLLTNNYTLVQSAANATAFSVNPITISIGSVSRLPGMPNPQFTINYSGPTTPYLQSLLSSLVLVTNAPATDQPGNYQITALIPASLARDIFVNPGTLTIEAALNNSTSPTTPISLSTIPAALQSNEAFPPLPLPSIGGGSASANPLVPANAIGEFQVAITPSQSWSGVTTQNGATNALSQASFTQVSPDGRNKDNKSTYAAGAQ